ncbi:hypothetical protein KR222_000521 [Zaprionus bogoriensis]|nr:hypothetical protein KR222_000521 [Zaprionus bogoriensis]
MLQQLPLLLSLLYLIVFNLRNVHGSCSVSRVTLRVPRDNDIGLFFDLTISNKRSDKSEMVEFSVIPEGVCTLNTTSGEQVQAGSIFGGDFGSIEPGDSMTVSLVWPTVTVYNRVGSCPIVVSTANHENVVNRSEQILYFDTRFETLDPGNHSLRRLRHFVDCKNWDQNYFRNCTPLDCEERYFGKRSFYNRTTEQCEPVPICFGDGIIYDFYANECIDMNNYITDEEIRLLKEGKFDNNFLDLQEHRTTEALYQKPEHPTMQATQKTGNNKNVQAKKTLSLVDFSNCFHHLSDPNEETPLKSVVAPHCPTGDKKVRKKSVSTSMFKSFYYNWYLPLKAESDADEDSESENNEETKNIEATTQAPATTQSSSGSNFLLKRLAGRTFSEWITLLVDMLLIILLVIIFQIAITIIAYMVVCLTLYGLMELIAMFKPFDVTSLEVSQQLTPRKQQTSSDVMTSASLMTQNK